ncbi:MAG: PAS domain S-box protein [Verrucomicrobia bacterium]|nr:PAS domain S-box protein [Verrucomicrobiota bacterium]
MSDTEAQRLEALQRYHILDTPTETAFDDLVQLAAQLCNTPIAAVCLLDERRVWFKARTGIPTAEVPRETSFAAHTVQQTGTLVVRDTLADERFREHPLVKDSPPVRFYAGVPLITPEGHAVGALCVMDRVTRGLTGQQALALQRLSRQVLTQLEVRRHVADLEREIKKQQETEDALRFTEAMFRGIYENATDGIFQTTPEGKFLSANPMLAKIYGFATPEELVTVLSDVSRQLYVDPARREEFVREMREKEIIQGFESQVFNAKGEIIWIAENARAVRDAEGHVRYYEGTVENVTERKHAEIAVREAERRFRSVWEKSADGMRLTDKDGILRAVNPAYCRIVGMSEAELIGQCYTVSYQDCEEVHRLHALYRESYQNRAVPEHLERNVVFRNGRKAILELSNSFVENDGQAPLVLSIFHDVTEGRRAEELLRNSEGRFRSIWERSVDGMRLIDKDGVTRAVNPAFCRLVGLTETDLLGRPYTEHYDQGEDAQARLERFRAGYRDRSIAEHMERRVMLHDGRAVHVELSISFVEVAGEDPLVLTVFHDLTARKKIEAALRESEFLYHSLVDNLPQNVFRKDIGGRVTFVNQRYCQEMGKTREEVIGKTDFDLFPANLAEKYQRDDQRIIESRKPFETVEAHFTPERGKTYVQVVKTPLFDRDGNALGIQGIFWDVTERKRIEEQLAAERDLLRALLDNVPDRIYFKDTESRFLQCSMAMAKRLGLKDAAEVVGKTDFDFHAPELAREFFADEQRILLTGTPLINKIERQLAIDGSEIWASVTKVPLRNRAGFITGIIGISRDITDIKRVERELQQARDTALESTRLKSQFLAAMSHEIRTPMNGVVGMIELLLDTDLAPQQREFAETVFSSAHALLHIINDILDFSKIEAGKLTLETTDFDLRETVERSAELLAHRAQAKNLEVISWMAPDVAAHLRGDPVRIQQILVNLIGNAVKFTERGEVVLRVLKESETDTHLSVKFSVEDTGIGIATEAQAKIFQAFTQADGSTTRKYGGTGLGLSISRQLVELMGGRLELRSTLGEGSTFWFTVTLEKQPGQTARDASASRLTGARLLVVTENAHLRHAFASMANHLGMSCAGVRSSDEALHALRDAAASVTPFDAAMLDIKLAGSDGLTLAQNIKAESDITGTKLILLTPLGQRLDAEIMRLAGLSGSLLKPVRLSRLEECLLRVLTHDDRTLSMPSPAETAFLHRSQVPPGETRPLRILLVEDNTVNQRVALLQLRKLGYVPDTALNGEQAVTAVQTQPYDVVLMDCHMPVMDGYTATQRIRDWEQQNNRPRLRILAMTADAGRGDAEHCYAAGMDDFITKPVHLPELNAALERVNTTASAAATGSPELPASTLPPTDEATLDFSVLNTLRDLSEPGQPDPVVELIDLFMEDAPERLQAMQTSLDRRDAEALKIAAHSLKGSAKNLGAKPLAKICAELEKQTHAADWDNALLTLKGIGQEFEKLRAVLAVEKRR